MKRELLNNDSYRLHSVMATFQEQSVNRESRKTSDDDEASHDAD